MKLLAFGTGLAALTFAAVSSTFAITTSGTLPGNETWSGTVTLTGDVTVPAGVTLTVSAGTTVKAQVGDDRNGGLNSARVELIVGGRLLATGTSAKRVRFTSAAVTPAASDWYGIRFLATADSTVRLQYLRVEWSYVGIVSSDGANAYPDIVDSVFENIFSNAVQIYAGYNTAAEVVKSKLDLSRNTFTNVGTPLYLYAGGSTPAWQTMSYDIVGNTVNNCTLSSPAIEIQKGYDSTGTFRVSTNSISSCSGDAINVNSNNYTIARVEIDDNVINGPGGGVGLGTGTKSPQMLIRRNSMTGVSSGISMPDDPGGLRIEKNVLSGTGTTGTGLYLNNGVFVGNEVRSFSVGVVLQFSWTPSKLFLWNWVHDNVTGISASGAGAAWFNRIETNSNRAAEAGSIGFDVRRNWWGTSTTAEMNAEGYPSEIVALTDFEDSPSNGRLDYRGWLPAAELLPSVPACRFAWPSPGLAIGRSGVTLEGAAYAPAGVALVEVSTDGGTSWNPAIGTDRWSLPFSPAATGIYDLRCRTTGTDGSPTPVPDAVTLSVDGSLPTTFGTLLTDEIWSGTVRVTGDLTVPAGRTLTVQPGSRVEFLPVVDDVHTGTDIERAEFVVEGDLVASGTVATPTVFTSASSVPRTRDWFGIRYSGVTPTTTLSHILLEWAQLGIAAGRLEAWPDIVDSTIRHTSQRGVELSSGAAAGDPSRTSWRFDRNALSDVGGGYYAVLAAPTPAWAGVTFETLDNSVACASGSSFSGITILASTNPVGGVTVSRNTLASCGNIGLSFSASPRPAGVTVFTNLAEDNVITGCGTGIQLPGVASTAPVAVRRNQVSGGANGLASFLNTQVHVDGNTFSGGTGTGVAASAGQVVRNEITGYGADGIRVFGPTDLAVAYNNIHDNTGYGLRGVSGAAHWNRIESNAGGAAQADAATGGATPVAFDVRRNWWGATTTAQMNASGYPANLASVLDIADAATRGRADYQYWLAGQEPAPSGLETRFVWPLGGATLARSRLTLEGTAYAPEGIQRVEVSGDAGAHWSTALGTALWRFDFDPPAQGGYTVLARVVDSLGQVEADPDVVSFSVDDALPTTRGTVIRNETWSGVVSLTGDLTIPPGRTVTLQPGTTVRVRSLADDNRGGLDTSLVEVIVQGTLVSGGTPTGRVTFTTDAAVPARGQWFGLHFTGAGVAAEEIKGVDVSWSKYGFFATNDGTGSRFPDLTDCRVDQVSLRAVDYQIWGTPLKPSLRIANGSFTNALGGISVNWAAPSIGVPATIDGNAFSGLSGSAVAFSGSGAAAAATVRGNTVGNLAPNSSAVLSLNGTTFLTPIDVESNAISLATNSNSTAIDIGLFHDVRVRGNVVTFGGRGIYIHNNGTLTSNASVELASNLVSNAGSSVYVNLTNVTSFDGASFQDNTFRDAPGTFGIGLQVQAPSMSAHRNNLFGSGSYDLAFYGSTGVDASNNYWGASTTSEMQSEGCASEIAKINDQRDFSGYGLVTYCPFATTAFGDQALLTLAKSGIGFEIRWLVKPAATYDLIWGRLEQIVVQGGAVHLGTVTCIASGASSGPVADTSPTPTVGKGFFFLARDHSALGSYGYATTGATEVPDAGACP
jgi:parallel beta helix pectate lyase-like protein